MPPGSATYRFDVLAGLGAVKELTVSEEQGAFEQLDTALQRHRDWWMGYLTYDLKNDLETLESRHASSLSTPALHFFIPRFVLLVRENEVEVLYLPEYNSAQEVDSLLADIDAQEVNTVSKVDVNVIPRLNKQHYLEKIEAIKQHIQRGDVYELNFCQEFYAEGVKLHAAEVYRALNERSPTPFSAFYGANDLFLMCASPERYFCKRGNKIYSQPIKGTAARGKTKEQDEQIKEALYNDLKERTENVMIVDLVRNDFSRIAKRNTVHVEELFGIYTFPQLHQMISTVSAELNEQQSVIDVLRNSFPMGSMTGAPKISAMELIDAYEVSRRGIYSGTVGYITPEGNADFNVVIRSIIYQAAQRYMSFTVGGAITIRSSAEKEYEECLLKARAMLEVLGASNLLTSPVST
jgi:para-aminobenzoate synthetase component 1